MKLATLLVTLALATVAFAQEDPAMKSGSLFRSGSFVNPITARTAMRIGDILTIVVNERLQGSVQSQTTLSKKDQNRVEASVIPGLSFLTGTALPKLLGDAAKVPQAFFNALTGASSTGANSQNQGVGQTNTNQQFTTRLSVVVKDVQPNGNMVLEGQRWVKINKDLQSIVFTGIVRRDDVRLDNTVLSEQIADLRVYSEGKGQIADRQRRGILTRVLEWLF